MSNAPTPSFGKRNLAARAMPQDPARRAQPAPSARIDLARQDSEPGTAQVPRSSAAGVLAACFGGGLHMIVTLHANDAAASTQESVRLLALVGGTVSPLPFMLLGSLWAGIEAGLSSIFVVHQVLRWLKRAGFLDYALGGGVAAGVIAGVGSACGLGNPDDGWAIEIVTGALAGIIYRFFAGVSRT